MNQEHSDVDHMEHPKTVALVNRIMRRQAALSIRVALVFIVLLVVIPMANMYFPALGTTVVLGFPVAWLILGVLFFPLTWLLSGYFVRESDRLDVEIIKDEVDA